MKVLRSVTAPGVIERPFRAAAEGSVTVKAIRGASVWLRKIGERSFMWASTGWFWEKPRRAEPLERLADDSRLITIFQSCLDLSGAAWRHASLRRMARPIVDCDLATRIRLMAWTFVIAVLTNTLLLWALGVSRTSRGLTIQVTVVIVGVLVIWRPGALAAAWKERARNHFGS
jgi:hypothetical protein